MLTPVPVFKSLSAAVAFKQIPLLDMRARAGNDTALVTQHAIAIRTGELRRRQIGCSRVAGVFGHRDPRETFQAATAAARYKRFDFSDPSLLTMRRRSGVVRRSSTTCSCAMR